ncbi:hypothetical protein MOPEL_073_01530 [Mobilicoccus pelagius NBRC 104925]|uniref:DUF7507 domain-containing protein n=3 Tax=Mobilicoccus TaxID=984996 RepID=H5US04_9MICO|nr:hypothetical protein MOPEL_073_01530 [Mobilicoccus pelagius NBRC 104925]
MDARYTVTVTNSGQRDGTYGPLTDAPAFPAEANVVEAKVMAPGATDYTTIAGTGPFALTSGPTTLAAGASHEYRVVIRYEWTKTATQSKAADCAAEPTPGQGLYNVTSLPAGQETDTSNNAACSAPSPQPDPGIDLKKYASGPVDADHSGGVSEGDTMTYTFVVTNKSKTLTLKDIKVNDPTVGTVTCAQDELAVEASTTCTAAKYALTQGDVAAGSITNEATASGLPPGGLDRVTASDSTTTPLPSNGGLTLTKTATNTTHAGATPNTGDQISYSFTVKNTGATTLTNVAVTDPEVGRVACSDTTLSPGASTACTASKTYAVTSADVSAGSVVNIASATATSGGKTVSADALATVLIAPANPEISLTKKIVEITDSAPVGLDAGDLVTYSLTVTNTGNVPVRTIYADDTGLNIFGISCRNELLAPGESTTCGVDTGDGTGSKTLTLPIGQVALDAGKLSNSATAYAYGPVSKTTVSASDTATLDLTADSRFKNALQLTKKSGQIVDANGNGITDEGDAIGYAFEVKNTGSQTLNLLEVNDPGLVTKHLTCEYAIIRPSETTICISKTGHVLEEAEVIAGTYTNKATAQAKTPQGTVVTSNEASATSTIPNTPTIKLEKIAGPVTDVAGTPAGDSRGDTIAYTFRVTNTGGVPVTGATITDAKLKLDGVACGGGTIAPGATLDCAIPASSATYTLTRADVNAGEVVNTATATAGDATDTAEVRTTLVPMPSLTLVKSHDGGDEPRRVGDVVTYRFTVRNDGAGTVKDLRINDPRLGLDGFCGSEGTTIPSVGTGDDAPDSAYGLTCSLVGRYVVTDEDVAGGRVANTATATALTVAGATLTAEDDDDVPTTDAPRPQEPTPPSPPTDPTPTPEPGALGLTKTARLTTDKGAQGVADVGDVITYGFVVTNPSGVEVPSVSVSDARLTAAGISVTCPSGPLAPGASTTCSAAPYTVTAADLAAAVAGDGRITNTATASGGEVTSPPASASVPAAPTPAIALRKTASLSTDRGTAGVLDAGDVITYSFVVTNTGPTPLTGVALSDPTAGATTCPKTELARGESMTCAAPAHTVTAADVAAGAVTNTATVAATGPGGVKVDATDTAVLGRPAPRIDLVKTATLTTDTGVRGAADTGDVITYGFTVTNPGNVPLTGVRVSDPTLGAVTCPKTDLAVGESMRCAGPTRTVTKADVDAGTALSNTATATGTPPATTPPTTPPTTSPGPAPSPTGEPTGTPTGPTTPDPVDDSATVTVPVAPKPVARVDMTKSFAWADGGSRTTANVGDGILYTFTVVNSGTTTVRDVTVNDPRLAALGISVACPRGDVRPGDSVTCRASAPYRITEADARRGSVLNTAVAQATSPGGTVGAGPTKPSSSKDTVTVPVRPGAPPRPNRPKSPATHTPGTPRPDATRPGSTRPGSTRPGSTRPGSTRPTVTWPGSGRPSPWPGSSHTPGVPGRTTCRTCDPASPWGPTRPGTTGVKGKGVAVGDGPPVPPDGPGDPFATLPTVADAAPAPSTGNAQAAGPQAAPATPVRPRLLRGEATGLVGVGLVLPASLAVFLTARRRQRLARASSVVAQARRP